MISTRESPYYQEFIDFITSEPGLQAMADYRLSERNEARLSLLLEKNKVGTLSSEEQSELDDYLRLEHIMRMMKYCAYEKLTLHSN